MQKLFRKILMFFLLAAVVLPANYVFASETEGTIDSAYKYAWASKIGWVNFYTEGSGSISITDSSLTGYLWNDNYGWIDLSPTNGGVENDGEGNLSGYAWGSNVGWVNFSGVVIDSSGNFTGSASGDIIGELNFDCSNCAVKTDWRPESARSSTTTSAGGGGSYCQAPSITNKGFSVSINDGQSYISKSSVVLNFSANSDVYNFEISNYPDFSNSFQGEYEQTKNWNLSSGDGEKIVYVKFFNKCGESSEVFEAKTILDTALPSLKIDDYKSDYSSSENIVVGGSSEFRSSISILIDDTSYTKTTADENGKWSINLGKMSVGSHNLKLISKDLAENYGNDIILNFSVVIEDNQSQQQSIIQQLQKLLNNITGQKKNDDSQEVVTVSVKTPVAFSGKFNLLPEKKLEKFVLSPLPSDVVMISQKFPAVAKTLSDVGITKIADVEKLKSASLKLPGITEAVSDVSGLTSIKGVPIAQLSSVAKSKIPSEIIFARAGNSLVDFNSTISFSDNGSIKQSISTLVGEKMQFIVRTDGLANNVKGYLLFKSARASNISAGILLKDLTASLLFEDPDLSQAQENSAEDYAESEKEIVVAEFDYTNSGDNVYFANVSMPFTSGEYEVLAVVNYKDSKFGTREMSMVTVIDPEGYVYEKNGNRETRISGAIVSLYWLNAQTKQYELWPASEYQQENLQITNNTGNYSFLVPEGTYFIKITAPGYLDYQGQPFEVKEGSGVHKNIQLTAKYWWLNIFDWKTILLMIAIILLAYNFYKDKIRDIALIKRNNGL